MDGQTDDAVLEQHLPPDGWLVDRSSHGKTPKRILDVGVGNGKSTQHLHEAFPQSNIYEIDISATAIAEAQKLNAPSISFSVRNIEETGFSPQQFDLICAY